MLPEDIHISTWDISENANICLHFLRRYERRFLWLFNKRRGGTRKKIVSMIRKYHNHKLQTTPWHREEEPLNHHETPGRQIKQSNQLSLPHQDDCNTRMDIKYPTTKHRTITDSHNGSNNKHKVNNNRTTALE